MIILQPTHLHSSNQSQADAEFHHIESKHLRAETSDNHIATLKWPGRIGAPELFKLGLLEGRRREVSAVVRGAIIYTFC